MKNFWMPDFSDKLRLGDRRFGILYIRAWNRSAWHTHGTGYVTRRLFDADFIPCEGRNGRARTPCARWRIDILALDGFEEICDWLACPSFANSVWQLVTRQNGFSFL